MKRQNYWDITGKEDQLPPPPDKIYIKYTEKDENIVL